MFSTHQSTLLPQDTDDEVSSIFQPGGQLYVIDTQHDALYDKHRLQAKLVTLDPNRPFGLNPFSCISNINQELPILHSFFVCLIKPMVRLRLPMRRLIEDAIVLVWHRHQQHATIFHMIDYLVTRGELGDEIVVALQYYASQYPIYWQAPSVMPIETKLQGFEFSPIADNPSLTRMVLLMLIVAITVCHTPQQACLLDLGQLVDEEDFSFLYFIKFCSRAIPTIRIKTPFSHAIP